MQAITTKYVAPGRSGSRIKATGWRGSISVPYPHDVPDGKEAHRVAVEALLKKWNDEDDKEYIEKYGHHNNYFGVVASGAMPGNDDAYAFIVDTMTK